MTENLQFQILAKTIGKNVNVNFCLGRVTITGVTTDITVYGDEMYIDYKRYKLDEAELFKILEELE